MNNNIHIDFYEEFILNGFDLEELYEEIIKYNYVLKTVELHNYEKIDVLKYIQLVKRIIERKENENTND